ncbi:MAG: hypothetical protein IJY37_06080 [Clostridia bacterium]|nr:hypothetical protein [Clostridia bacterium]MBQ8419899.1 hypothetical protein [Clostridia bacterium]
MFDQIGKKIKTLASTLTTIGIIVSIIVGFIILVNGSGAGFLVMLVGSLLSWLSSYVLYGLGELIDKTSTISANLEKYFAMVMLEKRANKNSDNDL